MTPSLSGELFGDFCSGDACMAPENFSSLPPEAEDPVPIFSLWSLRSFSGKGAASAEIEVFAERRFRDFSSLFYFPFGGAFCKSIHEDTERSHVPSRA